MCFAIFRNVFCRASEGLRFIPVLGWRGLRACAAQARGTKEGHGAGPQPFHSSPACSESSEKTLQQKIDARENILVT